MDPNVRDARRKLAAECIRHLRDNGFTADYYETAEDALNDLKQRIPAGSSIGFGGSETLKETGIIGWLTGNPDYTVFDRYHTDDMRKVFLQSLTADCYLMSTNALTVDGHLYNVDNTGNRVAALCYGPGQVFVIAGTNKLVRNIEEAVIRNEDIAAPANNIRLNRPNPCAQLGHCVHCSTPATLCNQFVVTKRSMPEGRIQILLINEDLGY